MATGVSRLSASVVKRAGNGRDEDERRRRRSNLINEVFINIEANFDNLIGHMLRESFEEEKLCHQINR